MNKSEEFASNIISNVISNLISYVITALIPLIAFSTTSFLKKQGYDLVVPIIYIGYLFLTIIIISKFRVRRITSGRESMMLENTRLIEKRKIEKIYSTRVTYWTMDESSPNRVGFRNALTKNIVSGVEVRRLWHIHNYDDVLSLTKYLEKYKGYDNLSVKCIIGNDIVLPELLISYPYAASVSIPQESSPRRICMAYHFRSKKDITHWMEYFNVLWNTAIDILVSGQIYNENIQMLQNMYMQHSEKDVG